MNKIVAFAGYATSGKDTAARCLIERGYTRLAFADALKRVAVKCNPGIDVDYSDDHRDRAGYLYRVLDAVEANDGSECVWDYLKHIPAAREFLQNLGQSIRDLDEDFWIRQVEKQILATADQERCVSPGGATYYRTVPKPTVITDVRYPNEAKWVTRGRQPVGYMGPPPAWVPDGLLIWIDRPGVGPCNGHESENPAIRDMCDVVIVNDGTVEDLWGKVLREVNRRGEEKIEG